MRSQIVDLRLCVLVLGICVSSPRLSRVAFRGTDAFRSTRSTLRCPLVPGTAAPGDSIPLRKQRNALANCGFAPPLPVCKLWRFRGALRIRVTLWQSHDSLHLGDEKRSRPLRVLRSEFRIRSKPRNRVPHLQNTDLRPLCHFANSGGSGALFGSECPCGSPTDR